MMNFLLCLSAIVLLGRVSGESPPELTVGPELYTLPERVEMPSGPVYLFGEGLDDRAEHGEAIFGAIQFPEKKWAKPGDNVGLDCNSDYGYTNYLISPPSEPDLPTIAAVAASYTNIEKETIVTTTFMIEDVQKGRDDGYYYCVVIHNGITHGDHIINPFSIARALLIISDPCEGQCVGDRYSGCEANYDDGSFQCKDRPCFEGRCGEYEICVVEGDSDRCTCEYNCPLRPDPNNYVCTDTCEFFFSECLMKEQICKDGVERAVDPEVVSPLETCLVPTYTKATEGYETYKDTEAGQSILLDSGVKVLGSPPAKITWWTGIGDDVIMAADGQQEFLTVAEESTTFYSVKVTQCKREWNTVHEIQPGEAPIINPELPEGLEAFASCSILPGGVVDNFYSVAHQLDLACTHVLASNVFSTVPWFVYGTFDMMDGDLALSAMTIYVGATIFEFQRGWIINLDGRKYPVMEGEEPVVLDSGHCSVQFKDNHLHALCGGLFEVYYDGVMAGHVRLLPSLGKGVREFQQEAGSFGLCWTYESGYRANWQVGGTRGTCKVDTSGPIEDCGAEVEDQCSFYAMTLKVFLYFPADYLDTFDVPSFSNCGVGTGVACHELTCAQDNLTAMQKCSINQAYHLGCDLKFLASEDVAVEYESIEECPELCEWREEVVGRGCPQSILPYKECA